jgi:signal transduction histidine kinase
MFHSARIKLTLWYVLISMLVSILFSITIFSFFHRELVRNEQRFQLRFDRVQELSPGFLPQFSPPHIDFVASENTIKLNLIFVNGIILIISSLAGYFLAGRTLMPIQIMLEKQNQFIGDASHELRTPLTALKTAIEVNLRDKKLTLRQAKDILQDNLNDINQLELLSNNLLSITKLQSNTPILTEDVNVKQVIEQTIAKINPLAMQKSIQIKTKNENVNIKADRNRITDVFTIFLDNAIKYSPPHTTIHIQTSLISNSVEITIKDQGIGIDKNDIPHIFERFYRANKARSKNIEGYGLGLSIAQEIVHLYDGTIRVESSLHKGTQFLITFPHA